MTIFRKVANIAIKNVPETWQVLVGLCLKLANGLQRALVYLCFGCFTRAAVMFSILSGVVVSSLVTHVWHVSVLEQRLENELSNITYRLVGANNKVQKLVSVIDTLNDEHKALTNTFTRLVFNNTDTSNHLVSVIVRSLALAKKLDQWKNLGTFTAVTNSMAVLRDQLDHLATTNTLLAISNATIYDMYRDVVHRFVPHDEPVLPPGTSGTVVLIDVGMNAVIIDIGLEHGLVPGAVFFVKRGEALVAKVKVARVYPGCSVTSVVPGWKLRDVKPGDGVFY